MAELRRYGTNPTLETRTESYETVDKQKRYNQIIEVLKKCGSQTAKEISVNMMNLGYTNNGERNNASPRLTELMQQGIVEPIGKTKCKFTGKTVTVFDLR
jgi:predicted HTH transcriptional regulator